MSESRDLILQVMGDLGMTQAEIARHVGRSPDWIRLVRQGKRPGNNLVTALRELSTTGHVSFKNVPAYRTDSKGRTVGVRAPVDDTWKPEPVAEGQKPKPRPTRPPDDPKSPERRKQRRNRLAVDRQVLRGGARKTDLHFPKKRDAKGRKEAEDIILGDIRRAARSQGAKNRIDPATGEPRGPKKMKFWATYENGHRVEVGGRGGYYVSAQKDIKGHKGLLQQARESGGFLEWLDDEVVKSAPRRGSAEQVIGKRLVNIEASEFYGPAEESAQPVHDSPSIHQ